MSRTHRDEKHRFDTILKTPGRLSSLPKEINSPESERTCSTITVSTLEDSFSKSWSTLDNSSMRISQINQKAGSQNSDDFQLPVFEKETPPLLVRPKSIGPSRRTDELDDGDDAIRVSNTRRTKSLQNFTPSHNLSRKDRSFKWPQRDEIEDEDLSIKSIDDNEDVNPQKEPTLTFESIRHQSVKDECKNFYTEAIKRLEPVSVTRTTEPKLHEKSRSNSSKNFSQQIELETKIKIWRRRRSRMLMQRRPSTIPE